MLRGALIVGLLLLAGLPAASLVRGQDDLVVTVSGTTLVGSTPLFLNGSVSAAPSQVFPACSPASCFDVPVAITVPAGYWNEVHGGIELTAHARSGSVRLTLLDQGGNTVATGALTGVGGQIVPSTTTAGAESVAIVRDIASGAYTLRVTSSTAPTSFIVLAQRELRPQTPAIDLLPDLVVLPITGVSATWSATKLPGSSCRPFEVAQGATTPAGPPLRCLRFDTTVGNLGPGRLFLTIPQADALRGTFDGSARFTQVVERTDYTSTAFLVGPAIYHAGHNHYHIANFVQNTLYAFDVATHTRGAQVGVSHKEGFCPINDALIALGMNDTEEPGASACQVSGGNVTITLESNFWDQYPSNIDDQLVDITGLPPGTYELVTDVNPTGVVHEGSAANNEARILVQIDANGARAVAGDAP